MLHSNISSGEKRRCLQARLASGELLRFPGAFNPLSARLIERKKFDGVYASGAVISADLGLPDIGLTTLSDVESRARQIARNTDLPCIVDADTGFGEPVNVARTVQILEDAGVAGCHIEDQVNPKRCGHLDGKEVVSNSLAVRRIRAAVDARRDPNFLIIARTDLRAQDGVQATIERAKMLVDAGADVIFPEALQGLEEYEQVRKAIDIPLLANITEFGKSELYSVAQLRDVGLNIVIWPVSLLRVAIRAAELALNALNDEGHLRSQLPFMQHRRGLYELLNYSEYQQFDEGIFDFKLG